MPFEKTKRLIDNLPFVDKLVRTARFTLDRRALSFYDPGRADWVAEAGEFELLAGSSSRDLHARAAFVLKD